MIFDSDALCSSVRTCCLFVSFLFTVSVFCLTSVAASGRNSLFSNSETGVSPSLDGVSRTLCLLHYATETSHLFSLRDFWRHFCLCRAAAHSDCCFFCAVYKYSYLLTYYFTDMSRPYKRHYRKQIGANTL